ncbi:hypothetical protein D9G75_04695 [Escherichia coli]|nr:hypothetical protein [Escherichia coli]MGS90456.1 hypothetical protein [Escherichia coli]MHQ71277.1 hypothetical protein [Escherichia coli]GCW39605.1 hypothetical protein HmCmsJML088_00223 [Escherichia coli]
MVCIFNFITERWELVMTLEQRVESLEKELASIKAQQKANEEFGELVRNLGAEMIKSAIRPGGVIYAAQKQTAGLKVVFHSSKFGIMN